jgi:hypothetical protein
MVNATQPLSASALHLLSLLVWVKRAEGRATRINKNVTPFPRIISHQDQVFIVL